MHEHTVDGQDIHRGCPAQVDARQVQRAGDHGDQVEAGDGCGELVGYVDYGAYSFGHSDPAVLSTVLGEKYNQLEEWMNNNKLVINPDKTHIMGIGSKKAARDQISIVAGDYCIKPTETEKLLGGQIHQSLKWNQHLAEGKSSLLKQLTSRNNGLKKISINAKFSTRLMAANGAVHSKLVYLITLWAVPNSICLRDVVPVARLEAFRALKISRLESFRALKFIGQIGRF